MSASGPAEAKSTNLTATNLITDSFAASAPNPVTSDYVVNTTTDHTILVDASAGTVAVTLPAAGDPSALGKIYVVKKVDSSGNAVSITTVEGDDIDFANSYSLTAAGNAITVQPNGTQYWILGKV